MFDPQSDLCIEILKNDFDINDHDDSRSKAIKEFQRRLVLINHALNCPFNANSKFKHCRSTPECKKIYSLYQHVQVCSLPQCDVTHCVSTRYLLSHQSKCVETNCPICKPVRMTIQRKMEKEKERIVLVTRTKTDDETIVDDFSSDRSSISSMTAGSPIITAQKAFAFPPAKSEDDQIDMNAASLDIPKLQSDMEHFLKHMEFEPQYFQEFLKSSFFDI